MRNKSMLWFWLVGAGAIVIDFIGFIAIFVAVLTAVQSGAANPYVVLYGSMFIWTLVIGLLSTVQLIMGIIHLVFYSKNEFASDSKVGHALYQVFFGLGLLGLIIVLVVNP
jgi:hypothetical protein